MTASGPSNRLTCERCGCHGGASKKWQPGVKNFPVPKGWVMVNGYTWCQRCWDRMQYEKVITR